jgi:predicted  nucleic acid-binding Zn-ribbon protein
MLENKDLQKVGEELGKVIEHNVTPVLDQIIGRMDKVEGKMDKIESRMDKIESRMGRIESQMVTKEYLDDKLADLEGSVIVRQRKEDQKVNLLINILKDRKVIKDLDIKRLKEIKVFPSPEDLL